MNLPAESDTSICLGNSRKTLNNECNTTNVQRRKSLNYQHQLSLKSSISGCGDGGVGDGIGGRVGGGTTKQFSSTGRFSPHPNEIFLSQSARLTIPQPLEKYDDTLINTCLPPPSPAPNGDCLSSTQHFTSNGPSQSHSCKTNQMQQLNLNHFQHQVHTQSHAQSYPLSSSNSASSICTSNSGSVISQPCVLTLNSADNINTSGSTIHKTAPKYSNSVMSPNSKFRPERYRGESHMGQKTKLTESMNQSSSANTSSSRYFLPPAKVQCDAYSGYLSSTVHTPVKRYVPTPPLASDIYTDLSATSSPLPISTQYVNMPLPYNYRVKCCHISNDESSSGHSKSAQTYSNIIGNGNYGSSSSSTSSSCPCPSPSPASSGTPISFPAGAASTSSICSPILTTGTCNKIRSSNPDEADSIIVIQPTINQGQGQNSSGTCLHCNTTRRTTGVHQTTQTTGPISPVPVSMPYVPSKATAAINDLAKLKYHEQEMAMMSNTHSNSNFISPAVTIVSEPTQQQETLLTDKANSQQLTIPRQTITQQQQQIFSAPQLLSNSPRLQHNVQQQQLQQQTLQVLPLQQPQQQQQQQQLIYRYSCKKRISIYVRREIARFFGVETSSESADYAIWYGRHRRLAIRRFGQLIPNHSELDYTIPFPNDNHDIVGAGNGPQRILSDSNSCAADRPDILPAQDTRNSDMAPQHGICRKRLFNINYNNDFNTAEFVERKASVAHMFMSSISYLINIFNKRLTSRNNHRNEYGNFLSRRHRQWSRSFAPLHVHGRADLDNSDQQHQMDIDSPECCIHISDSLAALIENEVFFDNPCEAASNDTNAVPNKQTSIQTNNGLGLGLELGVGLAEGVDTSVGVYMAERHHNGWRTSALNGNVSSDLNLIGSHDSHQHSHTNHSNIQLSNAASHSQVTPAIRASNFTVSSANNRSTRITPQLLDGVLENSRRPQMRRIKYFAMNDLDDRTDHRPFFTYWINTVQIVVLLLSIICYGIAPIGFGSEQKTGQVLVTSLSLQTVQHVEQRNLWIGPRNNDLVHMGAKFAACMRRDIKITDVLTKTRRQERETACCIRNDDSGCVQSSQADCSIRGLYPTKSISTWKKWSPGESGPGGRISGSVCGLDPKFCDTPASIAPYEWPDDITKWPICRKTNSFSQRYRYKDHTAEHMICEIIGHPCCTGIYGECRITTREYCDFVNGYFHEEASLCSQISCLNNVCGMFPFISVEIPDQFYRLLTSLCMHAGVLHLALTLIFQHLFLADLERLIGTLRTAAVYIMSGFIGNLTSAVLAPHRPEVGPSASLCGVVSSLIALLILMHWKQLHKPYVALFKLLMLCTILLGMGTLPYQLNFIGLLAGIACGAFLTISLVPFTSFTKYARKKKINLIWTCLMLHLIAYATLIATFYIYPSEFTTFNFVDDIFGSNGNSFINATNTNSGGHNNGEVVSSTRRHSQTQKPQFYYHHHSEDIIKNSIALTGGNSITRLKGDEFWPGRLYSRSLSYNINYSDSKYKTDGITILDRNNVLKIDGNLNSQPGFGRLVSENISLHKPGATANQLKLNYIAQQNDTEFKGL